MANQNDNDFIDDDLDGDLSSENNAISDAVEDTSEDISDYDDSEEGIFAPAAQKKKSGSSSVLLGTVAVVALLGVGGFYAYTQTDLLSGLKQIVAGEAPVETAEAPAEVPATVDTSGVAVADPAAVDANLPADPELAAIPQPQPIVNVSEDAATASNDFIPPAAPDAPVVADTPITESAPAPVDMAAANAPATDTVQAGPASEPAVADIPPPPTPGETTAAVEASTAQPAPPAPTPTPTPDVTSVAPAPTADPVSTPAPAVVAADKVSPEPAPIVAEPVVVAQPQQTGLAPVPAPTTGEVSGTTDTGLVSDSGQSSAKAVPKSSVDAPADTYFDSPGSSALTRIPTPSLDPTRGKSESIIIVEGAKKSPRKRATNVSSSPEVRGVASDNVAISSSSQEAAIVAAGRALRLGRYDAALEMYNDLYRANPRDGRILMGRAVTMQKLGRNGEAINAYEEVLAIDSDNPDAVVNMMGLIRKDRPAVALEKLLDMKQRYPDNAAILAQLGVAYADSGNLDDAAAALNGAVRIEPNNPQHYFNLAIVAERMKNRPRAIAYYEKALEVDAVYGNGRGIDRDMIYDRLARLRG